jgi:hypothetical protein
MKATTVTTDGKAASTGKLMRYMVERYHKDMMPYAWFTLPEIFNKIKNVPFVADPDDRELLMRPNILFTRGGDCDDKSIALASYCKCVGLPCRFIAARRAGQPVLHHVFCQVQIGTSWIHADPTYTFNSLGREREPFAEYKQI